MKLEDKNNNVSLIKEAIVKTIAFFDLFDYPVTVFELWRFINIKCELNSVLSILQSRSDPIALRVIGSLNGFYFLQGRSDIIRKRMERYNYTDRKIKKAILVARIFKFIPWIKMIAVSNIIGAHNLKNKSDIDIFIITEKDRVWLSRFFSTGLMKLLRQRPKQGDEQDKICLNFYLSSEDLDLKKFMMDNMDVYYIYWLANLVPIYNKVDTYQKLIKANNWLKHYLPNWKITKTAYRRNSGKGLSDFYYEVVDLLLGGLEQNLTNWQLRKLPRVLKDIMNQDTRVVIDDQVLKLHAKDRRQEYKIKLQQRLVDIELLNWTLQ